MSSRQQYTIPKYRIMKYKYFICYMTCICYSFTKFVEKIFLFKKLHTFKNLRFLTCNSDHYKINIGDVSESALKCIKYFSFIVSTGGSI